MRAGVDDDRLALGQELGVDGHGESLSLRWTAAWTTSPALSASGPAPVSSSSRPCWSRSTTRPLDRAVAGAASTRTCAVERRAAAAVRFMKRVRASPRTLPSHARRDVARRRRTARCGRRDARRARATWPSAPGSSSAVWSTLIPIPITTVGGRRVDPLHEDPGRPSWSPISTSLGHFTAASSRRGARADGVPRQQREPRPPLGVGTTGSKHGREGQRRTRRASPTSRSSRPRPACLVVGHHAAPVARRIGRRERVGRAGLGVQADLPLRAGDLLQGGLVERRPGGAWGVHGTRLAPQTRGGHSGER